MDKRMMATEDLHRPGVDLTGAGQKDVTDEIRKQDGRAVVYQGAGRVARGAGKRKLCSLEKI